jgi:hypothetical protein
VFKPDINCKKSEVYCAQSLPRAAVAEPVKEATPFAPSARLGIDS